MIKVPDEQMAAIRLKRNEIEILKAEVAAKESSLKLDLARVMVELDGVTLASAGLCFDCGNVLRGKEKCECPE